MAYVLPPGRIYRGRRAGKYGQKTHLVGDHRVATKQSKRQRATARTGRGL